MEVKRGDIFLADLNPVKGSEQGGIRPVLVIQNDIGNKFSPVTIVIALTSKITKKMLPTHIELSPEQTGLNKPSIVLAEQITTRIRLRIAISIPLAK